MLMRISRIELAMRKDNKTCLLYVDIQLCAVKLFDTPYPMADKVSTYNYLFTLPDTDLDSDFKPDGHIILCRKLTTIFFLVMAGKKITDQKMC